MADSSDSAAKLAAEVATVSWSHLRPHHERGAVVIVDAALSLPEVGAALARDDTVRVAGWLQTGLLRRTTPDDDAAWTATGGTFSFLIVRPWVLATPLPDEA